MMNLVVRCCALIISVGMLFSCSGFSSKKGESGGKSESIGQVQHKKVCIDIERIKAWEGELGGDIAGDQITVGRLGKAENWYAACLVTVEGIGGGNNFAQMLGLFNLSNTTGRARQPVAWETVGGTFSRSVRDVSFEGDHLLLDTLELAKGDPLCCPSIPATYKVELQNSKLVFSKEHPSN